MAYTAIQGNNILVDLTQVAISTGWSISGDIATHESCNAGPIELTGYTLVQGETYEVSYGILSISGGFLQIHLGSTLGVARTATGYFTETITATGVNPVLYFFSNANCSVQAFNIRKSTVDISPTQQHTIIYSPVSKKWTSFYTMAPDYGFSMYIRTMLFYNGLPYSQLNGSNNRNNLFGTQYNSVFKIVENEATATVKQYQSLSIQSNQLLVTTTDGIETSLGQISELGAMDFLKDVLDDTVIQVSVYSKEGVYSACFLKDKNEDLINGSPLKGNYAIIELTTTNAKSNEPLKLYTVVIVTNQSKIGAR